ncbi:MAG: metallophosphoesterase [Nocardioides sp.]|uniref:metallophosphoesterase n=1 Tax=Nocardioides sp. TaxID=35761 RepID=UPI00239DDA3E|nr:metallophosphoesterase [Nocardioides sp.]MDE0777240.1 metallophosphoesterase [Nocardioides sp.]
MAIRLGQHPASRHVVAHLSDPHLLADGARQYGAVDTDAGLVRALARLRQVDPPPQVIVFTGDLADKAEPAAYARLRELVEPLAEEMGSQVVWTMGNHDERAPYAAGLFGVSDPERQAAPQDRVHDVDGLRVIALDTSVPGYHHGAIDAEQLGWLAGVLATPSAHGSVLALHHPPIPVPMLRAAEVIELADQHLLAEVVGGTDVRAIIGGHFHFSSFSTFAGIPVSVASASCYTSDPAPLDRFVSGVDGHQAFTMLHLYEDRVVHTIVPAQSAVEVSGFAAGVAAVVEAIDPAERREILSRKDSDFNRGIVGPPRA